MNISTLTNFRFDQRQLAKLIDHARNSKKFRKLFGSDDTEKPGLWLVWDCGIYLMSNGLPALESKEKPNANFVAYAFAEVETSENGYNSKWELMCPEKYPDWDDYKPYIFDGDDGAEYIPLEMFTNALKRANGREIYLGIDDIDDDEINLYVLVSHPPKKTSSVN